MVQDAAPVREKEKIILGYLCTMAAEGSEDPVELPCVEYAGCYLSRGSLLLKSRSDDYFPSYIGMGMNATNPETKISIIGNVGDHLGYRSPAVRIEVKGSARDRAGMAMGDGFLRIEGDVKGGLGGDTSYARFEVEGNVGRINRDNIQCAMSIGGDVHWGIGEKQSECFIKVCGSVGLRYKKTGKLMDIAPGLVKNAVILIGGDVFGNLGKNMELAKIYIWGRVYGEIQASDSEGGFIYLNKKGSPLISRLKKTLGGNIGIKYVTLRDSGYLFAEGPDDIKEIVVS
jgi:formylmethanofuran dehydrogenase subunit C